MKSAVSAIIFAVLLLASPLFVAAGSTRQEVGAKVVAHLAKRQGSLPSCTTQACMTYAQTMLACIGNGATTDYLKAAKCMCDNKAVALSCYQTCNQDQNSLTEAQINEACAQIISNSATIESVISQFASSTRSAAATTTAAAATTTTASAAAVTSTSKPSSGDRLASSNLVLGAAAIAGVAGVFAAL